MIGWATGARPPGPAGHRTGVRRRPRACWRALPADADREELTQQHGFFHGGVIGTLADNACGYAAFTLAPADASILTVEYKINIVSPGDGERLVARAKVARPGRSLVVCQADIHAVKGGAEKLVATALGTLMLMHGRDDGPNVY